MMPHPALPVCSHTSARPSRGAQIPPDLRQIDTDPAKILLTSPSGGLHVVHLRRWPPMRAYYADESVTLYHGDSAEILPSLPAGSVTAVVTDPPYVIGAVSAGNMASKSGGWADMMNSSFWFAAWYRDCSRLLKHRGSLWTFCNWRTIPVVMRAASDAQLPLTSLMVWDKEWIGPGGTQGLRPSYELVALMAKPDFAIPDRGIPDVWRHKVGAYKPNGHPAEKPVPLVERILRTAAVPAGELVLDPFMGSGTSVLAARALGLRAIGIEAEERWCELAARRLSQTTLPFEVGGVVTADNLTSPGGCMRNNHAGGPR